MENKKKLYSSIEKLRLPIEIKDHIFSFLPTFDKWRYGLKVDITDKKIHIKGENEKVMWYCSLSFKCKKDGNVIIEMNHDVIQDGKYISEEMFNPAKFFSYQDMISLFKKKLFNTEFTKGYTEHTIYYGWNRWNTKRIENITIENLETSIQELFNHHDNRKN
jgi:hypothetical protein